MSTVFQEPLSAAASVCSDEIIICASCAFLRAESRSYMSWSCTRQNGSRQNDQRHDRAVAYSYASVTSTERTSCCSRTWCFSSSLSVPLRPSTRRAYSSLSRSTFGSSAAKCAANSRGQSNGVHASKMGCSQNTLEYNSQVRIIHVLVHSYKYVTAITRSVTATKA